MDNRYRFISLLTTVKRKGIENLITWIVGSTFFEDPASTKYHGAYEGGLLDHSLAVYDNYVKLTGALEYNETAIIACLLHDVCKIGTYKRVTKQQKDDNGKWHSVTAYDYKDDELPYGHGEKSVLLISRFIELTKEEILMIRWHMGAYESKECWNNLGKAQEMYPSVLFIHFADMLDSKGHNL